MPVFILKFFLAKFLICHSHSACLDALDERLFSLDPSFAFVIVESIITRRNHVLPHRLPNLIPIYEFRLSVKGVFGVPIPKFVKFKFRAVLFAMHSIDFLFMFQVCTRILVGRLGFLIPNPRPNEPVPVSSSTVWAIQKGFRSEIQKVGSLLKFWSFFNSCSINSG